MAADPAALTERKIDEMMVALRRKLLTVETNGIMLILHALLKDAATDKNSHNFCCFC